MTFIAEIVTTSVQNRNKTKTINENILLLKKTYREKSTESLIKFVDFMFFNDQFVINIQRELIIRDENTIIYQKNHDKIL